MIQDLFHFYTPCQLLQPYIRHYWTFKSRLILNTLTFPTGCPQLIFHKQHPLYIPELDTTQDRLTVSGQINFPSHLYADGNTEMIAVVFRPHTMSLFLHTPVSFFYNREISGYDLENRSLNELYDRIADCNHPADCIRLIEQWLLSQIAGDPYRSAHSVKRLDAAVRQILAHPQTPVTELASKVCLSKKQFERLFYAHAGILPGEYARIIRFQKTMTLLQQQADSRLSQVQIAYAGGYADQSHYIREIRKFSGCTPTALLKMPDLYTDWLAHPL